MLNSTCGCRLRQMFRSVIVVAGIALCASAQAQDAPQLTPKTDLQAAQQAKTQTTGWSLVCRVNAATNARACELSNSIFVNEGKQRFLALTFSPGGGGEKATAMAVQAILPHGVDFESGVVLQWGKQEPVTLSPFTTDAAGTFARAGLSVEQFEDMAGAEDVLVKFKSFKGDVFSVGFKTAGVATLIQNPLDLMK